MARRRLLALAGALAVVLGGCGGEAEPELYSVEPTNACLKEAGFVTSLDDLDFVASTASGGGLHGRYQANQVTIAFGEDEEESARMEQAYRNFAGARIPIDDVLFRSANAVLVWGAPPSEEERTRVDGCLSG
jgi:hypothetical protein